MTTRVIVATVAAVVVLVSACAPPDPAADGGAAEVGAAQAVEGTLTALSRSATAAQSATTRPTPTPTPPPPTLAPSVAAAETPCLDPVVEEMREFAVSLHELINRERKIIDDWNESNLSREPGAPSGEAEAAVFGRFSRQVFAVVSGAAALDPPAACRTLLEKYVQALEMHNRFFDRLQSFALTGEQGYRLAANEAMAQRNRLTREVWDELRDIDAWLEDWQCPTPTPRPGSRPV